MRRRIVECVLNGKLSVGVDLLLTLWVSRPRYGCTLLFWVDQESLMDRIRMSFDPRTRWNMTDRGRRSHYMFPKA